MPPQFLSCRSEGRCIGRRVGAPRFEGWGAVHAMWALSSRGRPLPLTLSLLSLRDCSEGFLVQPWTAGFALGSTASPCTGVLGMGALEMRGAAVTG